MASIKFYSDSEKTNQVYPEINPENFIHSRNLFDKNNVNVLNAYFVDGTNNITDDATGNNKTIYIPCKPNTTYTIQKTASPSNRAIGYTTRTPAVGVAVQGAINISSNTTTGSITTGNNAQYLVIRVWSGSQDTITYDQMIASVQIEEGSEATPYKPFTTNEINIDNEKFADTLQVGTYADSRSRVNALYSHNLFDAKNIGWVKNGNDNPNSTIDTSSTSIRTIQLLKLEGGKTYTLSGIPSGIESTPYIKFYATATSIYKISYVNSSTFTVPTNAPYVIFQFSGENFTDATNTLMANSSLMLNEGETSLDYEPYISNQIVVDNEKYTDTLNVGSNVDSRSRVNVLHSRNLLPNLSASGFKDGISWKIEGNKLTLNGTTSKSSTIYLYGSRENETALSILKGGIYNLNISGAIAYNKFNLALITTKNGTTSYIGQISTNNEDGNASFTLDDKKPITGIDIILSKNTTYTSEVYYLQINEGSAAIPFEPYNISNQIVVDNETFTDTLKVGTDVDSKSRVNFIHSRNLFDKDSVVVGSINADGSINSSDTSYQTSDFILVKPNTTYYITESGTSRAKYFDSSKTPLNTSSYQDIGVGANAGSFTTPANCYYIRKSMANGRLDNLMLNEGSSALPYEPYNISNQIVVDNKTFTDTLKVGTSIDNRSRVNILHSKNLFDKDNATITNAYFDSSTGALISGGEDYVTENYTEVNAETTYIVGNVTLSRVVFYNSKQKKISVETTNTSFTTPANTKYIRIQIMENTSDIIIQKGNSIITPSINVDGEEIYSKDNLKQYSTGEIRIGTWIDGKPLYRKVYSISNPSSSNTDYVDLTSLNIDILVHLYGYYKRDTGTFGIPFHDSDENYSVMFLSTDNKLRGRIANASGVTDAKVIIEYTKSTD